MENTDWTYEEFRAYAMLFAANTDGQITADEENLIAPTLAPEQYAQVRQRFLQSSDAEALDIILLCKEKYCNTPADKERVLADMRSIFETHHRFTQIDLEVQRIFERLFK
jgi:uncharacterized membrane protein YebE (DUF533 family)